MVGRISQASRAFLQPPRGPRPYGARAYATAVGYFLAASAFRVMGGDEVVDAITAFALRHGVTLDPLREATPDQPGTDLKVFAQPGQWTVVLWPEFFNIHDVPACVALSQSLRTTVSTV